MLYPKIHALYKRNPYTHRLIPGDWSVSAFEYLQNAEWVWTEKVDGTNVSVTWDGEDVRFGGRTENAQLHTGLVATLQDSFRAKRLAQVFDGTALLFGEGYGEKIQGGAKYRSGQNFVLFDVFCGGVWLMPWAVRDVAASLGVDVVPIRGRGTLAEAEAFVSTAPDSSWGGFPLEGVVVRPAVDLLTRRGERVIAKIKVKDYC